MKKTIRTTICLGLLGLVGHWVGPPAKATYLNEDKTLEVRGKVESKFTFKTHDSKGWATVPSQVPDRVDPPDLDAGDLIQQRNIGYIEGDYNLRKRLDMDLKLHATGRFLFEGAYYYGPEEIQDVRDTDKDGIDDFAIDADLWEAYANYTKGPFLIRMGRQKISWGETDVYPLLDRIMPIDNTYGGIFEDLDDRRIPLWAVRSTYNFGRNGFFEDLGIDAFWEPPWIDQQFAPQAPWGTVYNFPQPSPPPYPELQDVDEELSNSRWGVRLQGVVGNNLNFALAHFVSYMDDPALKSRVDLAKLATGDMHGLVMEKHFIPVHITGGSFSFFEENTEAVFRGEAAYFNNEPAFSPSKNLASLYSFLADPTAAIPDSTIPEWDVLRFSLAIDRPFWLRAINKRSMISFSLEVFNEYYTDYEEGYMLPAPVYPSGDFVKLHEWEHNIVTLINTNYMAGRVTPQVLVAYNPRGAGFWQPSIQYRWDPFLFKLQYSDVYGHKDISPGVLYDWDQVSFSLTYLF